MGLLDGVDWEGQVFKGGGWVEGRGRHVRRRRAGDRG